MRKLALALLVLVTTSGVASAQSFKKWTWSTYRMEFQVPTSFKVEENNAEVFSAGNGKINLTIYPEKGNKSIRSNMKSLLKTWAKENKLKFDGTVEDMEDLNGYWGVYVDGTGENGLPTTVLLLIDPDYPDISLYVWVQYQEEQLDNAVKILRSFVPA